MTSAGWERGDLLDHDFPNHLEAFLSRAFHATGSMSADNSVTAITQLEPFSGGGTGRKAVLSVRWPCRTACSASTTSNPANFGSESARIRTRGGVYALAGGWTVRARLRDGERCKRPSLVTRHRHRLGGSEVADGVVGALAGHRPKPGPAASVH